MPPAAFLKSVDAEHVAEALMEMFSRVGIPNEILTVTRAHISPQSYIRTSPYHPQTDGLVHGAVSTRRSVSHADKGKDWDKLLPLCLSGGTSSFYRILSLGAGIWTSYTRTSGYLKRCLGDK